MAHDFDLFNLNTFQVHAKAGIFEEIKTEEDLARIQSVLQNEELNFFILGGGANVLFVKDFDGLVIKNDLKGRSILEDNTESVVVRFASGEDWDDTVRWAVSENLSGIENLAFIPGTVGAAAVQNIAAYGQNFEDVAVGVGGISLLSGEKFYFEAGDCKFSYRNSRFKAATDKEFYIGYVDIRLFKKPVFATTYHSRYESLMGELKGMNEPYSIRDIYEAVVRLRLKKLPDWRIIGTAGSFFKNPVVSLETFNKLSSEISELQSYPVENLSYDHKAGVGDFVKVPAGRLLDELGWKGKRIDRVGTFERSALVVINLGGASGEEILEFTQKMAKDVLDTYEIKLEREVCVV